MVSVIENYSTQRISHDNFILGCLPKFTTNAKMGFVNLINEDDDYSSVKRFSLWEYVDGIEERSFALQIAFGYDKEQALRYKLEHNKINDVNFSKGLLEFKRYSIDDILSKNFQSDEIDGKILMIGFLGPGNLDRFYSPMNSDNHQPGEPNIYGLEFHAQIVAQILQK